MANSAQQIGSAIREARHANGLSQARLAERAGVSRAFVIDIEKGARPRAELTRVLALLKALGLSMVIINTPRPSFEESLAKLIEDPEDDDT